MEKGGLKKVTEAFGVTEYRLQNGLRVLYRFDDSAPIVAVMVTYHVGSRNEAVGHTGSTHILEHLLFKDSERFNKADGKSPTGYLEELGAQMNATTWLDRTNYFELLPLSVAEEAIALEADRMRYSRFSREDLAVEMTVVRNEFERGRNSPEELLEESVWATAFMSHPYHHPTIGWKEDIEHATVETLRSFYNRFYHPNNTTLTILGALEEGNMKRMVEEHFGRLPASGEPIPFVHTSEYEQGGQRRVNIEREGSTELLMVAQKMPEALHRNYPTFLLLAQILAGGRASRLDDTLVDTAIALYVRPFMHGMHDPSLFTVLLQTTEKATPDKALTVLEKVYEKVAKKGVTAPELARAKEQLLAQGAYERDGILNEAWALSEAVAAGDWQFAYGKEEAIEKVTLKQVNTLAKGALTERTRTVGVLKPSKKKK